MKRRVNKSNKVPNVKLRPAQPGAINSSIPTSSYWVQETQSDSQSDFRFGCPRPFKGVVLCATGNVDKPTILKQALELGATSTDAFTDRVTHLVAADHGGAKYMCALERKIPILLPSWITESYKIWLKGDDVDFDTGVAAHRIPIFSGITVCPSGIDCIKRRTKINNTVTQQGGTYVKNLERPVKVTHLLCSGDTETEKMRYAEKFNQRGEAKIWLIWEEWFWDSLDFGGRFDERKYLIGLPRPERRSCSAGPHSQDPLPYTIRVDLATYRDRTPVDAASAGPRSHAAEDDETQLEDMPASVKRRVPAETLQMWQTLLKSRAYEISQGALVRLSQEKEKGRETSPVNAEKNLVFTEGGGSVIDAFRRSSGSAPQVHKESCAEQHVFRRVPTSPVLPDPEPADPSRTDTAASGQTRLFAGMTFQVLGEAKCVAVRLEIEAQGGHIVAEEEVEVESDFIIVRLVSGSKIYRDEQDESERKKYRTDCWLEGCIFHDRVCSPDEHVSFVPLSRETPVIGSEATTLCFSGLDESEKYWMERLARGLGIALAPKFTRHCTHLLCPSQSGQKFDKAREWGIPVVGMDWIRRIATEGIIPDISASGQVEKTIIKSAKAKGKERERDVIVDITNNEGGTPGSFDVDAPIRDDDLLQSGLPSGLLTDSLGQSHCVNDATPPSSAALACDTLGSATSSGAEDSVPPTLRELRERERDIATTSIPSSTSPSPLRAPRSSVPPRSSSPVKVPAEVTKALQNSITNLLGKRPSEEVDTVGLHQPGIGKRARPQTKSKPGSRRRSGKSKGNDMAGSIHEPLSSYERPLSLVDQGEPGPANEACVTEESMTVMYEDPAQRGEKERLMSLVGNRPFIEETEAEVGKGTKKTRTGGKRRSTRIAGF